MGDPVCCRLESQMVPTCVLVDEATRDSGRLEAASGRVKRNQPPKSLKLKRGSRSQNHFDASQPHHREWEGKSADYCPPCLNYEHFPFAFFGAVCVRMCACERRGGHDPPASCENPHASLHYDVAKEGFFKLKKKKKKRKEGKTRSDGVLDSLTR